MTEPKITEALALLRQFEELGARQPQEAERLIVQVLEACGHTVTDQGFVGNDSGADCFFDTVLDGRKVRFGVEVKSVQQPASVSAVRQAIGLHAMGRFDRSMIICRGGFTKQAIAEADTFGAGIIDLLDPPGLRNWIQKHIDTQQSGPRPTAELIIRAAMREIVRLIALRPEGLWELEWRDLERVLREVFDGLGYQTVLTRPAKDSGFDLELTVREGEKSQVYLVEVKHWMTQKPGTSHIRKLVRVAASRKADGAVLLSSSGFAKTVYSGLAEFEAPVSVGDSKKIRSLCQAFYRLGSELWLPAHDLTALLFQDTHRLERADRTSTV